MSAHTPALDSLRKLPIVDRLWEYGTVIGARVTAQDLACHEAAHTITELVRALEAALIVVADHSASCRDLHHGKGDYHEGHIECPVEKRIGAVEVQIRAAIAKATGSADV